MNVNVKSMLKGAGIVAGVATLAVGVFTAVAWYVGNNAAEADAPAEGTEAIGEEPTDVVAEVVDAVV